MTGPSRAPPGRRHPRPWRAGRLPSGPRRKGRSVPQTGKRSGGQGFLRAGARPGRAGTRAALFGQEARRAAALRPATGNISKIFSTFLGPLSIRVSAERLLYEGANDGRREQGAVSGDAQEQRGKRGRGPAEPRAHGEDGQAYGGVGPRGCAARGRGGSPELQGSAPLVLRRQAHGHRRTVRGGEGVDRGFRRLAGGVQRSGDRVGHALRRRDRRRRDRGPSGDRVSDIPPGADTTEEGGQ